MHHHYYGEDVWTANNKRATRESRPSELSPKGIQPTPKSMPQRLAFVMQLLAWADRGLPGPARSQVNLASWPLVPVAFRL